MAQVPVFRGYSTDTDGKLSMPDDERRRMAAWVRSLAGKPLDIVVRVRQSQRSLDQNAYVWGVAYPIIAEAIGYDSHEIEEMHYGLVAKCFGEHYDKRVGALVPNKRSSKLSTKEFSEYMEWLVRFAAESCGVIVPLPGESEAA